MPEDTLQDRLLKALGIRGMTREGLARALGKDPAQVSKWGRGHHQPRPGTLLQIAEILHISMPWLVFGEGSMEVPAMEKAAVDAAAPVLTHSAR